MKEQADSLPEDLGDHVIVEDVPTDLAAALLQNPRVPNPDSQPRKRQRVVMDVVFLPTLAEVERKKGAKDNDLQKLGKLFKPKKKTDVTLDDGVLMSRLKPIGLDRFVVNLPRAELNQMVTRLFMSSTYGGSMQGTFPRIGAKKLAEHGLKHFLYLHLRYHPYAPQRPGGGGLWFSCYPEWCGDPLRQVHRTFTRDSDTSMWQYMGQYEIKAAAPLTQAEWLGLEEKTRNKWAQKISIEKWGGTLCARIQARKEIGPGREPTPEEVEAVEDSGRWKRTQPEDVKLAFDCGKERMGVWTLKCIGYDYDFQLGLCDKYPSWTAPESSRRKQKGKHSKTIEEEAKVEIKGEDRSLSPPAKLSRGKKRKRAVTSDTESGNEFGRMTEDEMYDEKEVFMMIRTRGTKSRPSGIFRV